MSKSPLCASSQLVASTLSESPQAAFLLNEEGIVLYENPAGKKLVFETTKHTFDSAAGDPRHSYHFSFFFSFSSSNKPWQDCFDEILNTAGEGGTANRTFDVNDSGIHQDYDVLCKRSNGTEFNASLRLAKVGACPCCTQFYLCAYVTPKVALDRNNNPFAKEESSLKCILNASFDPVLSIDESGSILMANEAAVEAFGYTNHDLLGQNIKIICGGGHAAKHDEYIRNYLDTGVTKIIGKKRVVPARRKDGSEFPVELGIKEVSCQDYGMPAGKVVFVAFLKDLSAERQHEQDIQQKANLMQAMINSSFDPMFQIDEKGIIRNCNIAAVALFGYRREELMGSNVSLLCGVEHAGNHDSYLKHYLKTGQQRIIGRKRKVKAKRKDGSEFEIELGVQEVESSSGGEKLFCGYVRDLTQQQLDKRRMRSFEQNARDNFFGDGKERRHDHSTTM